MLSVSYMIEVYSPHFRESLLDELVESGLKLKLFGKRWEEHPVFRHHGAGAADRNRELNLVYNASAINLHIHHESTMHGRLIEGAMAGGFFLINRLPEGRDGEPVGAYFREGRDFAHFESPGELVEKCRHYLAHPEERKAMALRMHEQALAAHDIEGASRTILTTLQSHLRETGA